MPGRGMDVTTSPLIITGLGEFVSMITPIGIPQIPLPPIGGNPPTVHSRTKAGVIGLTSWMKWR